MSGFNANGGPQSLQQTTLDAWMTHLYPEQQSNAVDGQVIRQQAQPQAQGISGKSSRVASVSNGALRRGRGNRHRDRKQAGQPANEARGSVKTRYRREGAVKDDNIEGSTA